MRLRLRGLSSTVLVTDRLRATRADVDLGALVANYRAMRSEIGVPIWAVVKADAYGHGAVPVAAALQAAGVEGLCVSLVEEGVQLREAGLASEILVLGAGVSSGAEPIIEHRLTPVVSRLEEVEVLQNAMSLRPSRRPLAVHANLDTGMSRLGAEVSGWAALLAAIARSSGLKLAGVMTHLACAGQQPALVSDQLARFDEHFPAPPGNGGVAVRRHAANTVGSLNHPESRYDFARVGLGLYGYAPGARFGAELKPVLSWRTEIVALRSLSVGQTVGYGATYRAERPTVIATLCVGYADGLSTHCGNRGRVVVRGGYAPIVGAVSMDMTTVDVTDIEGVAVGDEVCLLGRQSGPNGSGAVDAQGLAEYSQSIPWSVLTSISRRVPRVYR